MTGLYRCGLLFGWLMWLSTTSGYAQSFDDFHREIREHNPACKLAYQEVLAQVARQDLAGSLADPEIQVGVFAQEVETRVGPQQSLLRLGQSIPWPGKRKARTNQALQGVKVAQARFEEVLLQEITRFQKTYADFYRLGKARAFTQEHLALLGDLEEVVTERYEANAARYNDLIRIQIEMDTLKNRLATQDASELPLRSKLNQILGRPQGRAIPIPDKLPQFQLPAALDMETLMQRLEFSNPNLMRLNHLEDQQRLSQDLARLAMKPDFKLGLTWTQTGSAQVPDVSGSGKDPLLLTVGVNLPIWKKKNRARLTSAAIGVERVKSERIDVLSQLEAEMQWAVYQLDEARRKMALFSNQIIPKAEESLEVMLIAFETGKASYLELIDAERSLLEFRLSVIEAESQQLKALAQLQAVLGEPPFPGKTEGNDE